MNELTNAETGAAQVDGVPIADGSDLAAPPRGSNIQESVKQGLYDKVSTW